METLTADSGAPSYRLLTSGDPAPAFVLNTGARSEFLLTGDHAGREIPAKLARLGLADKDLDRHIAWDIGVAGLGTHLAAALDACFIGQRYSRLVIDCNRDPDSEESILAVSDGTPVPGNRGLTDAQRLARLSEIHRPYHEQISRHLDERTSAGRPTVLVFLHSFTPSLQGLARPWRFGVLHKGDSPFSRAMLAVMSTALGAAVGDNQPYAMDGADYSAPAHAIAPGLDYLELEVRQDLIGDEAGQRATSKMLASFMAAATQDGPVRAGPNI